MGPGNDANYRAGCSNSVCSRRSSELCFGMSFIYSMCFTFLVLMRLSIFVYMQANGYILNLTVVAVVANASDSPNGTLDGPVFSSAAPASSTQAEGPSMTIVATGAGAAGAVVVVALIFIAALTRKRWQLFSSSSGPVKAIPGAIGILPVDPHPSAALPTTPRRRLSVSSASAIPRTRRRASSPGISTYQSVCCTRTTAPIIKR